MDPIEIMLEDDRYLVGVSVAEVAHQIVVLNSDVIQASYVSTSKTGGIVRIQHIGCAQLQSGVYAGKVIRYMSV